jgi:spermidine dehydrogenase
MENDNEKDLVRTEADSTHEAAVTRRDFVGGTLLGAGASLLTMASPGAIREAQAQTVKAPMTGLGPEWTGPGGIGDYAHSNGNTHEVVNAAHAGIRNQEFDKLLRLAEDTGEHYDVVIVGCGQAGVFAGYTYRKERPNAKVLLLDQHPIFGGEAKQNEFEVDGYHLTAPQGATGFVVPWKRAEETGQGTPYYLEIGLPKDWEWQKAENVDKDILIPKDCWSSMHIAWERSDTGFFYDGKWVKNPWRDGFKNAPLSDKAKFNFLKADEFRTPPGRADTVCHPTGTFCASASAGLPLGTPNSRDSRPGTTRRLRVAGRQRKCWMCDVYQPTRLRLVARTLRQVRLT